MLAKVKPNTQFIGQNIIYFNRVNSTNTFAQELLKENLAPHGTVVVAEYQNRGRGQGNNFWISDPYKNLLFSVVFRTVTLNSADPFLFNKVITLSVYETLDKLLKRSDLRIKWPNDIYAGNRKLCGILIENNYSGQALNWSIAGVGINVNQPFEDYVLVNACSMCSLLGHETDREALLCSLLENMEKRFDEYTAGNTAELEARFDSSLLGFGKRCEFEAPDGQLSAVIRGCDKAGRLLIQSDNGHISAIVHGSLKQIIPET